MSGASSGTSTPANLVGGEQQADPEDTAPEAPVSGEPVSASSRAKILSDLSGLSIEDEESASEAAKALAISVKGLCTSAEALTDMLDEIHECALSSESSCARASYLFRSLSQLEVDGLKCRNAFLKRIQLDFERRAELRRRSRDQYLNLITLLCQVFTRVRVADGTTMTALCSPILEGFLELLSEPADDGLLVLSKQLQIIGPELQRLEPEQVAKLLCAVRSCIIKLASSSSNSTEDDKPASVSPETAATLLLTLELSHSTPRLSWTSKDETLNDFYDKVLPPGSRMTPMEVPFSVEEANGGQQGAGSEDANVGQLANQLLALHTNPNAGMGHQPAHQQQQPPAQLPIDISRPPPGYTHFASQPPTQPAHGASGGAAKPFHDLPPYGGGPRGANTSRGGHRGGTANNHWEGSSNHSSGSWNSSNNRGGDSSGMTGRPPRGIHGQQPVNDSPVGRLRRPLHTAANSSNNWSNGGGNGGGGMNRHGGNNGISGGNQWNSTDTTAAPAYGGSNMGGGSHMGGGGGHMGGGNGMGSNMGGGSGMGGPMGGGGGGGMRGRGDYSNYNDRSSDMQQHSGGGQQIGSWGQEDRGGGHRGRGNGGGGNNFGGGGGGGGRSMNSGGGADSSTDWGTFDATAMRGSGSGGSGGGGSGGSGGGGGAKNWGADDMGGQQNSGATGGWGDAANIMSPKKEVGATWGTAPSTGVQWGAKAEPEIVAPVVGGWNNTPEVSSPPSAMAPQQVGGAANWGGMDDVPVAMGNNNGWADNSLSQQQPKQPIAGAWSDGSAVIPLEQPVVQMQNVLQVAEAEATAAVANASNWSTAGDDAPGASSVGWGDGPTPAPAGGGWGGLDGGASAVSKGGWGKPATETESTGWGDPEPPRQQMGGNNPNW